LSNVGPSTREHRILRTLIRLLERTDRSHGVSIQLNCSVGAVLGFRQSDLSLVEKDLRPCACVLFGQAHRRNNMIRSEEAVSLTDIPNVSQKGTRLGNWLTREQAKELLAVPEAAD
jgi:hypothetical protein